MTPLQTLYAMGKWGFDFTIQTDEVWSEGLGYTDPATGLPMPLDGIDFEMTIRKALGDPSVLWTLSSDNGLLGIFPILVGGANSVLAPAVPDGGFSPFLAPGETYVQGTQGTVGTTTRTVWTGNLILGQGVP